MHQTTMLFGVTLFVDLIAMAATLWGAFYLFARGFPSSITLRAVIVLLLLSIFFFGAYNNLFHQEVGTAAWRAVLLILGLTTWYSLTYKLMSPRAQTRLRWLEILIYILGAVTATLLLATQPFVDELGNRLFVAHMQIGLAYAFYGAFQFIIAFGILYNLLTDNKVGLTRQGKYFLVASLFPAAAIVFGVIGLAMIPQLPRVIPDVLIFSGVLLLGISVARHQTLVERRTTIQDLPISAFTVLGLAAIYMFLAVRWGLPLERMGAVVAFAVLTHSFYDLARELLERQRIRHESTFRHQLRYLENQVSGEEALQTRLQAGLGLLCKALNTTGGFIAVRRSENFVVAASSDSIAVGSQLAPTLVACDDIVQFKNDQLPGIDWLAPTFEGQIQVAAIGLHKPSAKLAYSAGDLDLLAEVSDQVGALISISNLSAGRADQIQQLVAESEAKATELSSIADEMISNITNSTDGDFIKIVEDGLRHFSDYIILGQSTLADWMGIRAESHIERGKQVQSFLAECIESLRPAGARPSEPLPRVWYSYAVLHDAYIEDVPNREIMARLYISEGTFNRTRRNALRALARLLMEKHKRTLQAAER
jgi:hypothetical protein